MDARSKALKKFVMIKFVVGGKNGIVPRTWLLEQNTRCTWPDKDFNGDLATIVRNQYTPLPRWKTCKCKVLCHSGQIFVQFEL